MTENFVDSEILTDNQISASRTDFVFTNNYKKKHHPGYITVPAECSVKTKENKH